MAARRRSGPIIAVTVFVVLVVAVVAWWTWYTRTPEYSVRMVARAVDAGDWQAFEAYVDVDAIVAEAIDAEIDERFPPGESGFARDLARAARPQLRVRATERLREVIESRQARARELPSLAYALGPADLEELPPSSAEDARFEVRLPLRGRRVAVRLRLLPAGDRWRVVEVENSAALLRALGVKPDVSSQD